LQLLQRVKRKFLESGAGNIWAFWHAQALVAHGEPEKALEEARDEKDPYINRTIRMIALREIARRSGEWHPYVEHLEACFEETQEGEFLFELCQLVIAQRPSEHFLTAALCEHAHGAMDKLPERDHVSESAKDARITALWVEVQRLKARLAALESQPHEPRQDAHNASVPPAQTPKPHRPPDPRTRPRREASVGRTGGGRALHQEPDQVISAPAKSCPPGGGAVEAPEPHLPAVDDTSERPPLRPIVTRVERHAGPCPPGGQADVAPVPLGMEPGTPCGASLAALATSRR
jgi:hypothetical protein